MVGCGASTSVRVRPAPRARASRPRFPAAVALVRSGWALLHCTLKLRGWSDGAVSRSSRKIAIAAGCWLPPRAPHLLHRAAAAEGPRDLPPRAGSRPRRDLRCAAGAVDSRSAAARSPTPRRRIRSPRPSSAAARLVRPTAFRTSFFARRPARQKQCCRAFAFPATSSQQPASCVPYTRAASSLARSTRAGFSSQPGQHLLWHRFRPRPTHQL